MNKKIICCLCLILLLILYEFYKQYLIIDKKNKILKYIKPLPDDDFNINNFKFNNKRNKDLVDMLNKNEGKTLCLESSFNIMEKIFKKIKNIEGDVVEVGVWKGGMGIFLKHLIDVNKYNKKLYLYDTFNGFIDNKFYLDKERKVINNPYIKKESKQSLNNVINNFKKMNLFDSNITFVKGDIFHTGINKYPNKISLLHLDVDCFTPTYDALNYFYHRVSDGGYIIFDDYGVEDFGCKAAVTKYFKENNIKNELIKINNYSYYIKKKKTFINYPINNFSTFANYNINYKYLEKNDILSSVILNNTFYFYNSASRIIDETIRLKNILNKINIVWGFKLDNGKRRWEYYIYAWNPLETNDISNAITNYQNYFNNYNFKTLLKVFNNNSNKINYDKCYDNFKKFSNENIVNIIGFDLLEKKNTISSNINLYTISKDFKIDIYPIKTYGYTMNLNNYTFKHVTNIITHKKKDNTLISFLKKLANKYNIIFDLIFEKSYYESSEYIGIIEKFATNEIGIYYHCIDFTNFINFLIKYNYKKEFIDLVSYNKNRFGSFSFEIAINYKIINGNITNIRTAIYGIY